MGVSAEEARRELARREIARRKAAAQRPAMSGFSPMSPTAYIPESVTPQERADDDSAKAS